VDHNLKEEVEKLADDKNNIEINIRKSDKLEIQTLGSVTRQPGFIPSSEYLQALSLE
jgi:hypothetical protein